MLEFLLAGLIDERLVEDLSRHVVDVLACEALFWTSQCLWVIFVADGVETDLAVLDDSTCLELL